MSDPDHPPSTPAGSSFRELGVTLGLGLLLVVALAGWMAWPSRPKVSPEADDPRGRTLVALAGEVSCRECHAGETAKYHKSGHGQTLRRITERPDLVRWLLSQTAADPENPRSRFSYRATPEGLAVDRTGPDGSSETLPIEFAFGSGHHATTFVTLTDRDPETMTAIEHRLTEFTADPHLGITPGQEKASPVDPAYKTPMGRNLTTDQVRTCFDCHTTRLSSRDSRALDLATMVPDVSCERCHGPAQGHVDAARRGESNLKMPFGPGRDSAMRQIQLCGYCHRLPEKAPPGSIRPDNPELVRFQPIGLMNSRCYKEGVGNLSCTTCHDPHARTSTETSSYEATCLKCHSAPLAKTACPVSPTKGCIECHMPKRDAGQTILFTDHWIRIRPETKAGPTH